MPDPIIVRHRVTPSDIAAVRRLLDAAAAGDGHQPLGEQKWLDLVHGAPPGSASLLAGPPDRLAGFAQLTKHPGLWMLEVAVHPDHREPTSTVGRRLLHAALEEVAREGGGRVDYWIPRVGHARDAEARTSGFVPDRELLQLRRPLPVDDAHRGEARAPSVRAFRPGKDERQWLDVHNRAFAGHPEQGDWDLEQLTEREREQWFDPEGFLLHFDRGRLTGSCWTKVHRDVAPPLGEIYIISVDPARHGAGLGKGLVLAGLDWLAAHGLTTGMLHVDAANRAARRLYESLGFTPHHVDRAYRRHVVAHRGPLPTYPGAPGR